MQPTKYRAERPCFFRVIDGGSFLKHVTKCNEHAFENCRQVSPFQQGHWPAVNCFGFIGEWLHFIYLSKIGYYRGNNDFVFQNELSGSYLTIDLRYFFRETQPKNIAD